MVGDFGGVDVVPLLGAIAIVVCYGGGRRVTANFGGGDVVPFQGQCAMVGGEGDDQLWGSGRGAIAGCRCSVLWLGTLAEWTWCHCWVPLPL